MIRNSKYVILIEYLLLSMIETVMIKLSKLFNTLSII